MKILLQLSFVLSLWLVGELISKGLQVPIPGSVLGMVLLFIFLSIGIVQVKHLKELSDFLLDNLAFFCVPLGVGLLNSLGVLRASWWQIILVVIISTIMVIAATGLTAQLLAKGRNK